jgi:pimeloyl-ACP methyl ester carboxylesterase
MRGRNKFHTLTCIAITAIGCLAAQLPVDRPRRLPPPTGPFGTGRVTLVCEDASRIEPLDPKLGRRRILVDVWYPADPTASKGIATAEYLNLSALEREIGADALKKQLGASYDVIKAGGVITHAVTGAPFASSLRRSPVLIFSPGGGMLKELYSSQLEDLASHGYVVAAITHSYDGFLTLFPDGSHVTYDSRRWPKQPSLEGEANLNQLEWHTDDVRVVLDELSRPASNSPFSGRLDLARVGAFGHSFGGIVAAHACQKDQRIRACLNQDGAVASQPYYADARGWGMDQPFMLIERAVRTEPPSDKELAAMKLTRARVHEIRKRLDANRDRVLRATSKGSYHVVLQRSETTHMDFSDLQVLGAQAPTERETREQVLATVRSYTRAFFDRHIRGMRSPLLEARAPDRFVERIQQFGPAKRPK